MPLKASRFKLLAGKTSCFLYFISIYFGFGRTTGIEPAHGGFTIHCLDPLGYIRPYPRAQLSVSIYDQILSEPTRTLCLRKSFPSLRRQSSAIIYFECARKDLDAYWKGPSLGRKVGLLVYIQARRCGGFSRADHPLVKLGQFGPHRSGNVGGE